MPERGSRTPATAGTAFDNLVDLLKEEGTVWSSKGKASRSASDTVDSLRYELEQKGLKGFKRGGRVRKTGIYKLHKGEKVLSASRAAHGKAHEAALKRSRKHT